MRKHIKTFFVFSGSIFLIFCFIFLFHFIYDVEDTNPHGVNLNLKENGQTIYRDGETTLYDKKQQKSLLNSLYGNDFNNPVYYKLTDTIHIDTHESQMNLGLCSVFSVLKAIETNYALRKNINYNFSDLS